MPFLADLKMVLYKISDFFNGNSENGTALNPDDPKSTFYVPLWCKITIALGVGAAITYWFYKKR